MLQYDPDSSPMLFQQNSEVGGGRMTKRFDGLTIVWAQGEHEQSVDIDKVSDANNSAIWGLLKQDETDLFDGAQEIDMG